MTAITQSQLTVDKMKSMMFAIHKADYVLPVVYENKSSGGYLTYGDDNAYPDFLLNLFYNSSVHNSLILGKRDFICGEGLVSASGNVEIEGFIKSCNRFGDSLDDIFNKAVLDNEIFGGFALQIIYERVGGKITDVSYISFPNYRFNLTMDKLKYARNWSRKGQRIMATDYELYNDSQESGKTGTRIFYYAGDLTREQYPIPGYIGSLAAIETDIEISNFNRQSIKNGFFPSLAITYKQGQPETEEEKDRIEALLNHKFGGSSNAGKVFVNFCDSDNSAPDIVPIQQPDLDKMFTLLKDSVRDSIFVGHRISAPNIFGVMTAGKLGNTNEFNQGVQVFMKSYVKPARKVLLRIFNRILSTNFPKCDLAIKDSEPLDIVFTDEQIITNSMTQEEVRIKLKKDGFITNVVVPEGVQLIGDLPLPLRTTESITTGTTATNNTTTN